MPTLRAVRPAAVALVLASAASLGLDSPAAAGPAEAPRTRVATDVEIIPPLMIDSEDGTMTVRIELDAAKGRCVDGRRVILTAVERDGTTVTALGSKRAPRDGTFEMRAPSDGSLYPYDSVTVSVERLFTRAGQTRLTCSKASDTLVLL